MTALTVVAYNVLFGDAILVCIPEREGRKTVMRHVLVDVGNVLAGPGSGSGVFRSVIEDIERRLDKQPIDLYVMTHEHMDHVQGLLCARTDGVRLPPIDYAWLTASAEKDYYERFPEAARKRSLHLAAYDRVKRIALQRNLLGAAAVSSFLKNNDPRKTDDCVSFLRSLARRKTSYVHRKFKPVAGTNSSFREAKFSVWAPEHDTSSYYGRRRPVMRKSRGLKAPAGVDPAAFEALVEFSRTGLGDEMLAIDRAANNTSVVFLIEWRGWRLLFTGDAELKSWKTMEQKKQLQPVHFIKVGHHASHNGTPDEDLLEQILPRKRPDSRPRSALVSTCKDTYNGVPDQDTLSRLEGRVDTLYRTNDVPPGKPVEISFEEMK